MRACHWVCCLPAFASVIVFNVGAAESNGRQSLIDGAHYAFTTSTVGKGDLHGWSDVASTGLTGLAAADGICQARAAGANLPNPAEFVAWLSDRDNDAYCRVFGLTGRKADNCGLPALPIGAGPWLRTDGVPFADTIEAALDANRVYSNLAVDEFGARTFDPEESFTATAKDGTFSTEFAPAADCAHWTSETADPLATAVMLGSSLAAGGDWTADGHGVTCSSQQRLMCLQKNAGPALAHVGQVGQREAFASSVDVNGNLGGVAGGDAVCQSLATSAHLYQPASFKALLAATGVVNVSDRFTFDGPWYRRDGLLFAHDKAELAGGAVTLPLNVTEAGAYLGISVALTGATRTGEPQLSLDCSDWTSTAGLGQAALANSIALVGSGGGNWLSAAQVSCTATPLAGDWPRKLFCLSDADVVFHAEFDEVPAAP